VHKALPTRISGQRAEVMRSQTHNEQTELDVLEEETICFMVHMR
jgi:hypothetical protein